MSTDQLENRLAEVGPDIHENISPDTLYGDADPTPPVPNNSYNDLISYPVFGYPPSTIRPAYPSQRNDFAFGVPDPRLSILTNLYLTDPSLPYISYEEEKKEEASNQGGMEMETSGASPPSPASTSPLNPEARPYIPHLQAFSAPSSPELYTPSMEPIRPEIMSTLQSVFDNDQEQPENVTRRRLNMEAEAGENIPHHFGPLPQVISNW